MKTRTVNARQREVLRRVVANERPVTRQDSALSSTVSALTTRRLVEKRATGGGGWIAVATDAGRRLVAEGAASSTGSTGSLPAATPETRPAPVRRGGKAPTAPSHVVTTVDVALPRRWPSQLQATYTALREARADHWGWISIAGPDLVTMDVTRDTRFRAARLLLALHEHLQAAGLSLRPVPPTGPDHSRLRERRPLGVAVGPHVLLLRIRQHGAWATSGPSKRHLLVYLEGKNWGETFTRAGSYTFRLDRVLAGALDFAAAADREAEKHRLRELEWRRLDTVYAELRDQAVVQAMGAWREQQVQRLLREQAEAWGRARLLRDYAQALTKHHADDPAWRDWAGQADQEAQRLDPTTGTSPPAVAEPADGDLAPHLKQWPKNRPFWWTDSQPP